MWKRQNNYQCNRDFKVQKNIINNYIAVHLKTLMSVLQQAYVLLAFRTGQLILTAQDWIMHCQTFSITGQPKNALPHFQALLGRWGKRKTQHCPLLKNQWPTWNGYTSVKYIKEQNKYKKKRERKRKYITIKATVMKINTPHLHPKAQKVLNISSIKFSHFEQVVLEIKRGEIA